MAEAAFKQAKTDRRTAKSAFTRAGKAVVYTVESKRPPDEVSQALAKLQGAYENLVAKHDDYAKLIEEGEHYQTEEQWLAECQEIFMRIEVDAKMFFESVKLSELKDLDGNGASYSDKGEVLTSEVFGSNGISSMQSVTSEQSHGDGISSMQAAHNAFPDVKTVDNKQGTSSQLKAINSVPSTNVDTVIQTNATSVANNAAQSHGTNQSGACTFKLEKPKLQPEPTMHKNRERKTEIAAVKEKVRVGPQAPSERRDPPTQQPMRQPPQCRTCQQSGNGWFCNHCFRCGNSGHEYTSYLRIGEDFKTQLRGGGSLPTASMQFIHPVCTTVFPGSHGFQICFEEEKYKPAKAAPYTYSKCLDKLFVKLHSIVPITVRMQVFPALHDHYIRATIIYEQPEHHLEIVERCPNHIKYHKDGHKKHLLRCQSHSLSTTRV
ncbi:Tumor protein 63 [Desmophyllum pertusum]|uniref:Tumor protein 63 n=1 Tax=Desmophyllum pertusum TaxID=174260 RepID=A0A9W9ZXQ1_9CNID|nr:Tumor protein 63 [Desmophyllum pertusum]